MKLAGYKINYPSGLLGENGTGYDYILAGNGLFVEARGSLLTARILIAPASVRGLIPLEPEVILHHGKIPVYLYELALNAMLTNPELERFVAITWDNGYHIHIPDQEGNLGSVKYSVSDNTILDLHSHGRMKAFFSSQDNRDEQGFQLYGVIGKLIKGGQLRLRVGVYGYHFEIDPGDIFEGYLDHFGGQDDLSDSQI